MNTQAQSSQQSSQQTRKLAAQRRAAIAEKRDILDAFYGWDHRASSRRYQVAQSLPALLTDAEQDTLLFDN